MSDDTLGTPDRIGRYRVLQKLGDGGMGEVWEAEQTEPVRRRVALKVIKPGMDTRQVIARFETERQALAVMDHPGIAKVFDAGATEAGRPYFAMELVRGLPLNEYCDTHKLTTAERLALFAQVCSAVQHAHQKGVIHRDLKPSNVLVTLQDDVAVPKVIDFGVAKAIGQDLTNWTLATQLGAFLATPRYVSPEQAEMSGLDVDTRTDIYSLGVMLYELLVGAPPLDLVGIAWSAMSSAIREREAPAPSTRLMTLPGDTQQNVARYRQTDPAALRRELKGDLDSVVLKCLEKDRTRRYDTASALAQDLQRHLRHEPVLAQPPSAAYRARKFVRRHRVGTLSALALVLLLVGFTASVSVQARRIARERDRTAREAAKAEAVREFMEQLLAAPDPVNALGPDASVLEAVDRAVSLHRDRFSDNPEVDAAIRTAIGRVYLRLGQYDKAEPLLLRSRETRSAPGYDQLDLAETLGLLADLQRARGNADSAEALYSHSLELIQRTGARGEERVADLATRRGGLLTAMGRYDDAQADLLNGLDRYRREGPDNHHIADALLNLATLYRARGDLQSAERYARDALAHQERVLPAGHALIGASANNLAVILDDLGRKAEAAALYRRALAIHEANFGAESEYIGATLTNLALVLTSLGDAAEAEAMYRRALAIDRKALGDGNPGVAIDRLNLGFHLCLNGKPAEGITLVNAGVRVLEGALRPDQYELGQARSLIGVCLGAFGRYAEAERVLRQALSHIEASAGGDHPAAAVVRKRLADLYDAWGRPESAARYRD